MQREIQYWQWQSPEWMDSMWCIVLKINESKCITKNPLNSYSMVHAGISGVADENVFWTENDMYKFREMRFSL